MKKRNYVIRQNDSEGAPIIAAGKCELYSNDKKLIPSGYTINHVINSPAIKTIYVQKN